MEFFQKFFKKKVTVQDVLSSLDNFSPDVKSLNNVEKIATEFFGLSWKFNLEMYINTMNPNDKKKYLPLLKNVLAFDKALGLWVSAQQVLKGVKTLSSDIVRELPEYEEYLPKFGVEGVRLLEKFKAQLNISTVISETRDDEVVVPNESEETGVVVAEKTEETATELDEELPSEINEEIADSVVEEKVEKQEDTSRILTRVSEKDLEEGVFCKFPREDNLVQENLDKVIEEVVVSSSVPEEKRIEVENSLSADWELSNFMRVNNFVAQSREVMGAIALFKGVNSLEDYPYYGFIVDTLDYLIVQAEKILSTKSNEEILKFFVGGKEELEKLLQFYKKQKDDEVVIVDAPKLEEKVQKEYEIIED